MPLCAGAGKTSTLEGLRGRDTWGTEEGDGVVHLAIDELFGLVHGKAIAVGECITARQSEAGLVRWCLPERCGNPPPPSMHSCECIYRSILGDPEHTHW